MSNPTGCGEVGADLAIDVHRSATAGDHLHHSRDPTVVKTFAEQNFPKEGPTDRVVGLMEVDFQEDGLEVFGASLVKNLVKDEDPVKGKPPLDEGRLIRMGDAVGQRGHPIGVPLCQDAKDHIDHCDRAELANIRSARNLGDRVMTT